MMSSKRSLALLGPDSVIRPSHDGTPTNDSPTGFSFGNLHRPFRQVSLDFRIPLLVHRGEHPTNEDELLGDRILEHACEGMVRINHELLADKAVPNWHPYDDRYGLSYELDPPGDERWSNIMGTIKTQTEDCETLSAWLAAWYRYMHGIEARCAIYPSVRIKVSGETKIGRHVVVFVPRAQPLYTTAPWDSDKFIRTIIPGKGYIEDPSVALGMYYRLPERRPLPDRTPFSFTRNPVPSFP